MSKSTKRVLSVKQEIDDQPTRSVKKQKTSNSNALDAKVKMEIKSESFGTVQIQNSFQQSLKCENDSKDCDCMECRGKLLVKGERIDVAETICLDGPSDQTGKDIEIQGAVQFQNSIQDESRPNPLPSTSKCANYAKRCNCEECRQKLLIKEEPVEDNADTGNNNYITPTPDYVPSIFLENDQTDGSNDEPDINFGHNNKPNIF